ncbi:hypothetical protein AKO1_005489 [Acrasis kona]|uniref:Glycosidase n=1 Tax=Acrasis kona TaxID=1008807 RepID=A0AAW2ZKL1_9EUKA
MIRTTYLIAIIAIFCSPVFSKVYNLKAERLSQEPLINYFKGDSEYLYNYNSAVLLTPDKKVYLAVRVQNLVDKPKDIYNVGPSYIAIASQKNHTTFNYISSKDVIIDPKDAPYQGYGCEDPRIATVGDTYYMYYSALGTIDGRLASRLALATCNVKDDVTKKANWKLQGLILPEVSWSKSGALLDFNATTKYLFWGDNSIDVATTSDLLKYTNLNKHLLQTRKDKFDSSLVESGPPPAKLKDGNYLFLYNSGRSVSTPNPKPGWDIEYNVGYAILDKNDPTKVLERSDEPVFSPVLDWERCDNTSGKWKDIGLTPLVVFIEGWVQVSSNEFVVIYQGCDSFTGAFHLVVN